MEKMFSILKIDARRRASKDFASFLRELALAGEIQLVSATQDPVSYWWAPDGRTTGYEGKTPEQIISMLGGDGVTVEFTWRGGIYKVYFSHGDFVEKDEFGEFGELFERFLQEMKESGEYYHPGTSIPWWRIPRPGEPPVILKGGGQVFLGRNSQLTPLEQKGGFCRSSEGIIYSEDRPLPIKTGGDEEVEFFQNYLLIGRKRVVFKNRPEEIFDDVQNPEDIIDDSSSRYQFERNDRGDLYFVPERSEKEMIAFFEENHFSSKAKRLREKRAAAEAARLRENNELEEFVRGENTLLVEVVFHQPGGESGPSGAIIINPSDNKRKGRYNDSNPVCQYLYGIQEKGWKGHAERGMLISIPAAKEALRHGGGILHLEVPKSAMGRIIGARGANICAVKEALRKKGLLELRDIRLHPQE